MFIFTFFVSLFGEELFFRGFLLQHFKHRLNSLHEIFIQIIFFMIINSFVAFFMNPIQGIVYVFLYSGLTIGLINGWSALKTNSIWPGLISASILNIIFVVIVYIKYKRNYIIPKK